MGKTKIATIDDSQPEEVKAKKVKTVSENSDKSEGQKAGASEGVIPNDSEGSVETEIASLKQVQGKLSSNDASEDKKADKKTKKSKASVKKGKAKYRSKKYKEAAEKIEKSKRYPVSEAIDLAKASSYSKFEGSLEMHIGTSVKSIRGLVSLPFTSGKKLKVLAFGKGAEDSGADIVGDDDKLNEIIRGKTEFDVIVTTAEWMPKLARAAKVLGPRGLMPSPKNGTITSDLKKAVTEIQSGKVEYKTQKDSKVIHLIVGKTTQPTEEIAQNIKMLFNAIGKTKAKKIILSPSMGPGVKVDLSSI